MAARRWPTWGGSAVSASKFIVGREEEKLLQGIDLVVTSPGVPGDAFPIAGAHARGIPVWSELELGSRLLPNPLIAITGTNGKTTTTALLGEIFRSCGRSRPRSPATSAVRSPRSSARSATRRWIVCEVGVAQLDDADTFRPRIAVLLNLEPDHLDRYGTFEWYADTKLRVFEQQTEDDVAIVPAGFGAISRRRARIEFSARRPPSRRAR